MSESSELKSEGEYGVRSLSTALTKQLSRNTDRVSRVREHKVLALGTNCKGGISPRVKLERMKSQRGMFGTKVDVRPPRPIKKDKRVLS